MKKLTYTLVSVCAAFLLLAACSKDPASAPYAARPDLPDVQKIAVSGNSIDLSLFAYSLLPPVTRYEFSIQGLPMEEMKIQSTLKKEWHLDKLEPGIHRINIHVGVSDEIQTGQCNFHFNISDGIHVQSLSARKIGKQDFGFDLVVNS